MALAGFLCGLVAFVSAGIYVMASFEEEPGDRIYCGDDPMPQEGYACLPGGTYAQLEEEQYRSYARLQAASRWVCGVSVVGTIGAVGLLWGSRAHTRNARRREGAFLEENGALEAAEDWYFNLIEAGRREFMIDLGRLQERRGDLEGAEAWFREAATDGYSGGAEELNRVLEQLGKPAEEF